MTSPEPKIIEIKMYRHESGELLLSVEGIALLLGVDADDLRAHVAANDIGSLTEAPKWIPNEWLKQGRRRSREAMAATGIDSMQSALEYWAEKEHGAEIRLVLPE